MATHDDEILRETHRVKEQLSTEFQRDPLRIGPSSGRTTHVRGFAFLFNEPHHQAVVACTIPKIRHFR